MKFTILSEAQAQDLGKEDQPLISITDVGARAPQFHKPWKDVLRLEFEDLCPLECQRIGWGQLAENSRLFNEEDAIKILDFVAKHKDSEHMVVHCKAGISRSAAIACFLADKFGDLTEGSRRHFLSRCNPNPHVLRVMEKVYEDNFGDQE